MLLLQYLKCLIKNNIILNNTQVIEYYFYDIINEKEVNMVSSINEKLFKLFKWDLSEIIKNFIGLVIFCIGINLFIEPNHLYSGGVLGLAQLLNRLINDMLLKNELYLTGIIYLLFNIPLLIMAHFKISKSFCVRTIFTVGIQTILIRHSLFLVIQEQPD